MKKIIVIFFLWLLIINIFALFALNRLNLKSDTAQSWINSNEFYQKQNWNLISIHANWDSVWYLDIAKNGYFFEGYDKLSTTAFLPLYPFFIKKTSFLTGGNFILAG
jgi:uncharacterized protein YxeA